MRFKYWIWPPETVPSSTCDSWVARYNKDLVGGAVGADEAVDLSVRSSRIKFVDADDVVGQMRSFFSEANKNCFGVDLSGTLECQFTQYKAEYSGFYDWHIDSALVTPTTMFDRKLSCVILLSDPKEFSGGEFLIFGDQKPVPLRKGSVVVFPSIYNHKVTPVTGGTRHSMVAWAEGPYWR